MTRPCQDRDSFGMSLVELMVSMVILSIIMIVVFHFTNTTTKVWKSSADKIQAFQGARMAFEAVSRHLSQATLNTSYDYFDSNGNSFTSPSYSEIPGRYGRQSGLHFISGPNLLTKPLQVTHAAFFQAPLGYVNGTAYSGLNNTLNSVGYYLTYNSDDEAGLRPTFLTPEMSPLKYRFRLMQFLQPSEEMEIYIPGNEVGTKWFTGGAQPAGHPGSTRVLAENIVALVILPKLSAQEDPTGVSLCPEYSYDSRIPWKGGDQPAQMNQLPPLIHVAMVALDEAAAERTCLNATAPDLGLSDLFSHAAELDQNIQTELPAALEERRLTYRIFQTDVALRGARWSK